MVDDTIMPMAWNEPGNGKRPDPWGKSNDAPPDLEQIFKKINEKFRRMFGSGKKDNNNSGTPGQSMNFSYGVLFAIIAGLYILSGLYIVKPAEQGVITRFGKYNRTVAPGPHWYPQFFEKKLLELKNLCL